MTAELIILGSGNLGRVTAETARDCGLDVAGFLCGLKPVGETVAGTTVVGTYNRLDTPEFVSAHTFVVAIADSMMRRNLSQRVLDRGGHLATLIHPSCKVSPTAQIGRGTVLHGFNSVRTGSRIGDFVVLDDHAHVGNDIVVGDACYLAPGCLFNSGSSVGADTFVGAGAVVLPEVSIGQNCLIGAGTIVTKNVRDGMVAAGNPVRELRPNTVKAE